MSLRMEVTSRDHVKGANTAGVALLEYGDYECSYCGAANSVVGQLLEGFEGQLKYVFRHFPLTEIHPQAELAAEIAELAGTHGKFWGMHEALYENQASLGPPLYIELGNSLGITKVEILTTIENHSFAANIQRDYEVGLRGGVDGTPVFFINGRRHVGSYDYAGLRAAIGRAVK